MTARRPQPWRPLVWGLAVAVLAQLALAALLEFGPVALRDPEFGRRLRHLRDRRAERPDAPLVLALGSSRVAMGVRPDVLGPGDPLVFNLGMTGGGPLHARMTLRRALDAGVRPAAVLLEVWPPACPPREAEWLDAQRVAGSDLPALTVDGQPPAGLNLNRLGARLGPWFTARQVLMSQWMPTWLPWDSRRDVPWGFDEFGWLSVRHGRGDAGRPARLEHDRGVYAVHLATTEPFEPEADAALRALLADCRSAGIAVTLVYLPESTEFRAWYPAASLARIDAYLARLAAREGVQYIDARDWVEDDLFLDGHHLVPPGAEVFTRRLAAELRGAAR
jgi:hypothetical protein